MKIVSDCVICSVPQEEAAAKPSVSVQPLFIMVSLYTNQTHISGRYTFECERGIVVHVRLELDGNANVEHRMQSPV